MAISKSTFYRYAMHANQNMVAHMYGNSCLCKPKAHAIQAIAIVQCNVDISADYISHRSQVLTSRKKVSIKVLPAI